MAEMCELNLALDEAKKFILYKQGLLGEYRFSGKEGVLAFVRQAGCVQFDPIDVCGKNAELVLQSRVSGFTKKMLYELLYEDRKLLDNFDKNLAIIPVENWKYFKRDREWHLKNERSFDEIQAVCAKIKAMIAERGPLCSADLEIPDKVDWYWATTKLSRAALEHMYFRGELAIHHKKRSVKYYDLIENCIPSDILKESDPYPDDFDHKKWRVLERIGSVGMLWNRPSDAWLGIGDLKSDVRNKIFESLVEEGRIVPVKVDGIKYTLYCLSEDVAIIRQIRHGAVENAALSAELCATHNGAFAEKPVASGASVSATMETRCEFIAALDNMMWDRNLIKEIWGFDYKWEIYTPAAQRKYGYYVLPVLYGENLVGRIELVYDQKEKKLNVKNLWYEPEVKVTKKLEKAIESAVKRFEKFSKSQF
ncbi:MAG: winged helix DNA-binding domain-containing protein [Treponemataceae bacterium]|nr:winged helix DNA-binding domain-containing protein [Treponemataceae bacterium]